MTPSPSWIQDFLTAVTEAEQREHQAVELSEDAARQLLAWCLNGPDRSRSRSTTGGQPEGNPLSGISCTVCGGRVYGIPAREPEGGGSTLDSMWLCPSDRARMAGIMGTPSSPGRPQLSGSQKRIQKYRRMSAGIRGRHSTQAPAMPKPGDGRPTGTVPRPAAPSPGPFS